MVKCVLVLLPKAYDVSFKLFFFFVFHFTIILRFLFLIILGVFLLYLVDIFLFFRDFFDFLIHCWVHIILFNVVHVFYNWMICFMRWTFYNMFWFRFLSRVKLLFFCSSQAWCIWDNNICWGDSFLWHFIDRQLFWIDETGTLIELLNKY